MSVESILKRASTYASSPRTVRGSRKTVGAAARPITMPKFKCLEKPPDDRDGEDGGGRG